MKSIYLLTAIIVLLTACNKSEPPLVHGCMEPTAINYDPSSTANDDSCIFPADTVTFPINVVVYDIGAFDYNSPFTEVTILNIDNASNQVGGEVITSSFGTSQVHGERLKANTHYRIHAFSNSNFQLAYKEIRIESGPNGYSINELASYEANASNGGSYARITLMEGTDGYNIIVYV